MMNTQVIILGLIQGFTEFLPVSSSGHLALAQIFFGTQIPVLSYDLVLHVATTAATVLFFMGDIVLLLKEWLSGFVSSKGRRSYGWSVGWAVAAGTVITGLIGFVMKDFVETAIQNSLLVGLGLVFTGLILILSRFLRIGIGRVGILDGIFVGIAQGIAVLPGVSRSGMTMIAGQTVGLSREETFRFSFLLSIPAILGATAFQVTEVAGWDEFVSSLPQGWYIGAMAAFFSGLAALVILRKLVMESKWWLLGIYCLALGLLTVIISYMGVW